MKIGRERTALLCLLFSSVAVEALLPKDLTPVRNSAGSAAGIADSSDSLLAGKANPVGTEHAPVDGKDGMPHDGPFVETSAGRERKKTGAEEVLGTPLSKSTKDQYTDKITIPQTNDAVMDDPSRRGPADGTRGTEGGVSTKSKDAKPIDKIPDSPKEARPLPHSEAEKIKGSDRQDVPSVGDEDKKLLGVLYAVLLDRSVLTFVETHRSPGHTTLNPAPREPVLT